MADKKRLYYLDNLKVFLIIIVIIHHVGQAYGSTGGSWYYSYPGERVREMGLFFLFNASYFMGLFFLISGYFFPASYDRHGAKKFIIDKLIRFGIPVLFGFLIMIPAEEYVKYIRYTNDISFSDYYIRHWFGIDPNAVMPHGPAMNFGHLWFIEHLLVYAVLYAVIRSVKNRFFSRQLFSPGKISWYAIALFILLLGIVTNLMRTKWGFPMDRWIGFLGFIQMEPAHIPQYLSFFVIGILVWRWKLLESISMKRNVVWFAVAIIFYAVNLFFLFTKGGDAMFYNWEYREAFFCVGICIGLLALFRLIADRTNRIMTMLSDNAFGAYFVHVPIVVALQFAFDPVAWGPGLLFTIISILSVPLSFALSWTIRLIPGVKRVI
jgi:peptidoglycan/LPS O-acetylase OafA/YrhL